MKKSITISLNLFLASMAAFMLCVPVAEAKDRGNNGNGSVEFSIPINYTESSTINGANGSSAEVNAALSTGFALAYNINDNFQLGGSFSWANRNYSANVACTSLPCSGFSNYNGTLSTSSLQMNALWYFMPGDFTPFASVGFGTTFVDSNIPNGTGSSSCYWDPYWGYVCGTYQPTKSSTNISYSFGLGARMDFSRQFALQGSWNKFYIDGPNSKPQADMIRVDFIFRM